jgi:hypothetical protein
MIRREESGTVWLIHQAAHAFVAGQIAEHWIGGGQMTVQPREELLIAAYCHDAGWLGYEQQPRINAQGQPCTFTEMDLEEHFGIWESSIRSVFAQNRYAGLLTALHCKDLYEQRLRYLGDPPEARAHIQTFLDTWRAWIEDLIATLGSHPRYSLAVQPDPLAENLRLLQVWDYLSLALCMSHVYEQTVEDIPYAPGERDVLYLAAGGERSMVLNPFPLDHPLTLWIDARQVIGGPFDSDDALRAALDGVPYKPLVFEIGPLQ